jgi:oxygen-independent coproporphyrinogen-3 oxidase
VTGEPGFGVYVHWPFCLAKCPYCDFNSHVRHKPVDEARFAAALSREIAHMAELAPGRRVLSIFFGGGTPSLMSPAAVGTVLDEIAGHWSLDADIEVTLEANPTSVEAGRFRGYRAAGVNRVSLGVQALHDADLAALGRQHSVQEALAAVDLARGIFPRLSFDLIYARPGQSVSAWRAELEAAIAHAADHLSLYQLTIEQGTPFFALHAAGKLQVPEPELARALYEATQEVTEARGLPAYEISNHARPGAECRHNLVYWRYGEYAGVGPGAHGRLIVRGVRRALSTERVPETWLERVEAEGHGIVEDEPLDREAQGDEMLLMGLRLKEGVDLTRYRMMTGRPIDPARLTLLAADGFVEPAPGGRLRATPEAWPVLDAIVADLAA